MSDPITNLSERPVANGGVPRYELTEWRAEFGVIAGVTARDVSLAVAGQDGPVAGIGSGAWRRFQHTMAPDFPGVVVSRQVHGTEITTHAQPVTGVQLAHDVDGHLTGRSGVLLAVTLADCIPVYLVHPGTRTVALLHAGWRGVAGRILERGVRALANTTGAQRENIVIHCGVGICEACYEVSCEVVATVRGVDPGRPELLDLRRSLVAQARRMGVERISASRWCTAHDHDRFHSHRRSGGAPGRMVAYLGYPVSESLPAERLEPILPRR